MHHWWLHCWGHIFLSVVADACWKHASFDIGLFYKKISSVYFLKASNSCYLHKHFIPRDSLFYLTHIKFFVIFFWSILSVVSIYFLTLFVYGTCISFIFYQQCNMWFPFQEIYWSILVSQEYKGDKINIK